MAARLISRSSLHTQSTPFSLFLTKQLSTTIAPFAYTHKLIPFSSPSPSPTTTHNSSPLLPSPSLSSFRLFTSSKPNAPPSSTSLSPPTTTIKTQPPPNQTSETTNRPPPPLPPPPPYDPFSKKPAIEDLQEVFHKMRTDGFQNNAVKLFKAFSKDGLTHEALELFAHIKDKGQMPDVVAHTAVIEAYATAGKPKDALKVIMRMLACGVAPNAYTYSVLIKALVAYEGFVRDARKYLVEMMGKGMRPNAGTYVAVFEAFVADEKRRGGSWWRR